MRTIVIDLTECDLNEVFPKVVYRKQIVEWSFPDQYGEEIKVQFVPYEEEEEEE